LASIGISIGISCPKWPGKAAVLGSQRYAKALMLYEKSGARGIRTLDTA